MLVLVIHSNSCLNAYKPNLNKYINNNFEHSTKIYSFFTDPQVFKFVKE